MIALIQTAGDVKDILSIESVSVLGLMLLIICYLAWQLEGYKKKNTDLNDKIYDLLKEHQADLKDGNKDSVAMVSRYETLIQQLNVLHHGKRDYYGEK